MKQLSKNQKPVRLDADTPINRARRPFVATNIHRRGLACVVSTGVKQTSCKHPKTKAPRLSTLPRLFIATLRSRTFACRNKVVQVQQPPLNWACSWLCSTHFLHP